MLHTIYIIAALLLGPQASLATIDQRMMLVSWIVCCGIWLMLCASYSFHRSGNLPRSTNKNIGAALSPYPFAYLTHTHTNTHIIIMCLLL
jgi:hypothetical protein